MTKIEYITDENKVEHVVIDNGNGTFTSMSKAAYDEQQAANEAQAK
jgi:hypothetical protein